MISVLRVSGLFMVYFRVELATLDLVCFVWWLPYNWIVGGCSLCGFVVIWQQSFMSGLICCGAVSECYG